MGTKAFFIISLCVLGIIIQANLFQSSVSPIINAQNLDCYVSQIYLSHILSNRIIPTATLTETPVVTPDEHWEEEPNDSADEATGPISSGISYFGYPDGPTDYFSFDVPTQGQISITLENLTGSGMRQLLLYYGSTNLDDLIVYDTDEPFQIVRNERAPGRYYVLIYVESGHNSTTPYTLRVNYPVALTGTDSLNSVSQPLPTCTPTSTSVTPTVTPTNTSSPTTTPTPSTTPTQTLTSLESFEQGVSGWRLSNVTTNCATGIEATSLHATEGVSAARLAYNYSQSAPDRCFYYYDIDPHQDWSGYERLVLDFWKDGAPIDVSVVIQTGSNIWQESPGHISLTNGHNTIEFDLTSNNWSGQPIEHLDDVLYLGIALYPSIEGAGEVFVDNIRLAVGSTNTPTDTPTPTTTPTVTNTATDTPSPTSTTTINPQPSYLVTDFYVPSGWMLNGENPAKYSFNPNHTESCHTGATCYRISWQPELVDWLGMYWLHPDADGAGGGWSGPGQPGCNLTGSTSVTFWARGETGGEVIAAAAAYNDSNKVEAGPFTLTTNWSQYTVDVSSADLTNVVGAFAWLIFREDNAGQVVFYLDDIRYQEIDPIDVSCDTPTPPPVVDWCDNFNDGQIDLSRWLSPTNPNLVYEQNGVLNLRVSQEQSQIVNEAELEAIYREGQEIREVTFTMALESFEGDVPAGAGLAAYLEDGRDFSIDVGPGPQYPTFEFSLCRTPSCSDYDDYDHPDGAQVEEGVRVPVKIVWLGETVNFYLDNALRIEPATDAKPITGLLFYLYGDIGSVFHATVDDLCVKYTEEPTPTPTPTGTPRATSDGGFNFETSTQNWTTSEGAFKYAVLHTTQAYVYSGVRALRLTTELRQDEDPVFRHTEAFADFSAVIPEGFNALGPYDLSGRLVSCMVYLPTRLVSPGNPQAYIRLFVKDQEFDNLYSDPIDITPSTANTWIPLTVSVASSGTFDSTKVRVLGVRIDLQDNPTLSYTGPIFVDHCAIEQP